jgi:hypothetical protein
MLMNDRRYAQSNPHEVENLWPISLQLLVPLLHQTSTDCVDKLLVCHPLESYYAKCNTPSLSTCSLCSFIGRVACHQQKQAYEYARKATNVQDSFSESEEKENII